MIDAATAQNADDDRDDDDANEAEMSAGAKRADLFDVDPLQKLSLDEFIQEIEKKCGSQAAQAYKLLEQNKSVCYKDEPERSKDVEQLM